MFVFLPGKIQKHGGDSFKRERERERERGHQGDMVLRERRKRGEAFIKAMFRLRESEIGILVRLC